MSVWNTVKATKMPSGHTCPSTTSALRNRLKQSRLFSQRPDRRTRPPLQRSPGPLGAHTLTQGLATTARVSGEPRRQGRPGALRLSSAVLAGTSFHSPADSALLSRGRAAHSRSSEARRVLGHQLCPFGSRPLPYAFAFGHLSC